MSATRRSGGRASAAAAGADAAPVAAGGGGGGAVADDGASSSFGVADGRAVAGGAAAALARVDEAAGGVPAVELFVALDSKGVPPLALGHAAIRFTVPASEEDGKVVEAGRSVMFNVCGLTGHQMFNLVDPAEYLFGTSKAAWDGPCEQAGIYNRDFVSVRLLREPSPGTVGALLAFCEACVARERAGQAGFRLVGGRVRSLLTNYMPESLFGSPSRPGHPAVMGNCAYWTSSAMAWAGLLQRARVFPMNIFADFLEAQVARDADNVRCVLWRRPQFVPLHYPNTSPSPYAFLAPNQIVRNFVYSKRLHRFADFEVTIREEDEGLQITPNPEAARPPRFLRSVHAILVALTSIGLAAVVKIPALAPVIPSEAAAAAAAGGRELAAGEALLVAAPVSRTTEIVLRSLVAMAWIGFNYLMY